MSMERSIAARYAAALFELNQEGMNLADDLHKIAQVAMHDEVKALLVNSQVSSDDRAEVVMRLAKVDSEPLKRLLVLLCARNKAVLLPLIDEQLEAKIRESKSHVMVDVTVAKPLDKTLAEKLKAVISKQIGKKVDLNVVADASIIGGLILNIGDRQIDYSVRGRLNSLKRALSV